MEVFNGKTIFLDTQKTPAWNTYNLNKVSINIQGLTGKIDVYCKKHSHINDSLLVSEFIQEYDIKRFMGSKYSGYSLLNNISIYGLVDDPLIAIAKYKDSTILPIDMKYIYAHNIIIGKHHNRRKEDSLINVIFTDGGIILWNNHKPNYGNVFIPIKYDIDNTKRGRYITHIVIEPLLNNKYKTTFVSISPDTIDLDWDNSKKIELEYGVVTTGSNLLYHLYNGGLDIVYPDKPYVYYL